MKRDLHDRLARLEACSHSDEEGPPDDLYLQLASEVLGIPPSEVWPFAQREARKQGYRSAEEWLYSRLVARFIGPPKARGH